MEGIIHRELVKSGAWMENLSVEERRNVELLVNSIINKILHDPITGLKEESRDNSAMPYVAVIRRLFGLD